jgi:hypothetical protein
VDPESVLTLWRRKKCVARAGFRLGDSATILPALSCPVFKLVEGGEKVIVRVLGFCVA